MAMRYPDSRNRRSVEDGTSFERYVIERLRRSGIALTLAIGRDAQFTYGDTLEGIEIKLDARADDTRRLSIEIAERTALHRPWVASGIFADHAATRYAQGTPRMFWVFTVDALRAFYRKTKPITVDNNPPTIRKFYLPFYLADTIAESCWTPIAENEYTPDEADRWLYDHGYTRNAEGRWVNPKGEVY